MNRIAVPGSSSLTTPRGPVDRKNKLHRVFVDDEGGAINEEHLAERFRRHLQAAGIKRAILFERSTSRQPIRLHDTRATFITVALANSRSEAWVQDRTGHKSSIMINRYRRAARSVAELGLGDLHSLAEAVPELSGRFPPAAQRGTRLRTRT